MRLLSRHRAGKINLYFIIKKGLLGLNLKKLDKIKNLKIYLL